MERRKGHSRFDVNENEITATGTFSHSGTGDNAEGMFSATSLSWVDAT